VATSVTRHIADLLRTALATETTFNVTATWRNAAYDLAKARVYPYVIAVTYSNPSESITQTSHGVASCGILANVKASADVDETGTSEEAAGIVIRKVHKALYDHNHDNNTPNDDGTFISYVLGWTLDRHDGHFDNGDAKADIGFEVTVHFTISRK
jgi:hypothetical protein